MKPKGLIVKWDQPPGMKEGESVAMTFGHEKSAKARALRQMLAARATKTTNWLADVVHVQCHHWKIVIITELDYTNPRTGEVTTERIKSIFDDIGTLGALSDRMMQVQAEDNPNSVKTLRSRTITCYCKD